MPPATGPRSMIWPRSAPSPRWSVWWSAGRSSRRPACRRGSTWRSRWPRASPATSSRRRFSSASSTTRSRHSTPARPGPRRRTSSSASARAPASAWPRREPFALRALAAPDAGLHDADAVAVELDLELVLLLLPGRHRRQRPERAARARQPPRAAVDQRAPLAGPAPVALLVGKAAQRAHVGFRRRAGHDLLGHRRRQRAADGARELRLVEPPHVQAAL